MIKQNCHRTASLSTAVFLECPTMKSSMHILEIWTNEIARTQEG